MADVRSFVALTLAGPGRAAVEALLRRLQASAEGIAWSRVENLHVTLKFLGGVSPARLDALQPALAAVAAAQAPFAIEVCGTGGFPSPTRPRAVWVGVVSPALAPLAAAVDAACASLGFTRETRPFRPHVTLGRVRRSAAPRRGRVAPAVVEALSAERDTRFGASPAEALVLYRSDLGPGRARHIPVAHWPLDGPPIGRV